jgi:dephospho-CoA kinase
MKTSKLIVLVGMPGAGKSSCVEHLKEKAYPSVYFGGITLKEVEKRGLDITPENEKEVREDLRRLHGKEAYATLIAKEIDKLTKQHHEMIIVDGLYSWSEYKYFKQKYGDNAVIVAITAPRALRHQRLTTRAERPLTLEQANDRDYAEIESIEKGGPIANADYTIVNESDLRNLLNQLDNIVEKIG